MKSKLRCFPVVNNLSYREKIIVIMEMMEECNYCVSLFLKFSVLFEIFVVQCEAKPKSAKLPLKIS